MSIYKLKPAFQSLLRPFMLFLRRANITPNQLTLAAVLFSVSMGVWIFLGGPHNGHPYLFLPLFLFCRMALNALDGMMAREFKMQSTRGAFYNELGDIISDITIFAGFFSFYLIHTPGLAIFITLAILSEFVGVIGPLIYHGREISLSELRRYEGPMGKSDRAFAISLVSLFLFFIHDRSFENVSEATISQGLFWIFIFLNVLLFITIIRRARALLRLECIKASH